MSIWKQIFDQSMLPGFWRTYIHPILVVEQDEDHLVQADHVIAKVVPLGQRFYPSESAFPLRA